MMKKKMPDVSNTEIQTPELNKTLFKFDGKYSNDELNSLANFMHEEFPHVKYGGPRDKGIIVENPPVEICLPDQWKEILDAVLLPEWETINPKIRRDKVIARFVPRLFDNKLNKDVGGNAQRVPIQGNNEIWIRIAYQFTDGTPLKIADLTYFLMHELTEIDFWSKTRKNDPETNYTVATEINAFSNQKEYRKLLDEKIANRRALRALRRYWPNAYWINPESIYDEDK